VQWADIPSWAWQVLGAFGGLALGLGLGAWHLKRAKSRRRPQRPARPAAETRLSQPASELPTSVLPGASRFGSPADSPQQRLLEHLRQSNLDLAAQLKASAAQHAKLLRTKDEELAEARADYDERVETLRQQHSTELRHLMALLVEQVDGIHKAHANHVKALEAEVERWRRMGPHDGADEGATTTFASTELLPGIARRH
jgi:DNA anti-recombination protein RmuC